MAIISISILPKTIFGRFVLIIVVPIIIIQIVTTCIFYQRHWSNVHRHMQNSVVSELVLVTQLIESAKNQEEIGNILKNIQVIFAVSMTELPAQQQKMGKRHIQKYGLGSIKNALESLLEKTVDVYYIQGGGLLGVDIHPVNGRVLHVELSEKRVYSITTSIFMYWVCITSGLLVVIAIVFMRNQVRSILDLADAANKLGSGRKDFYYTPTGANEIKSAGYALLKMKKRLERHVESRSELLTHIAHDLRTPLTRMKLKLAVQSESDLSASFDANLKEMEELLTKYLDFAKGEGNEESQYIDIQSVVTERINHFNDDRIICENKLSDVMINVKPNAMRRMLDNLLSNACKFARNRITIRMRRVGYLLVLEVSDDGPGVPEGQYEKVLEPFFKASGNNDGFGLGLAIVKTIAAAHGGFITLGKSESHGGLMVQVSLPQF